MGRIGKSVLAVELLAFLDVECRLNSVLQQ